MVKKENESPTTGSNMTFAIGYQAGTNDPLATGTCNVAIGHQALRDMVYYPKAGTVTTLLDPEADDRRERQKQRMEESRRKFEDTRDG